MNKLLALVALTLTAACTASTDPISSTQAAVRSGQFCGGIAAFQCPDGQVCIDDPSDGCDPRRGGADCGGICVRRGPRDCEHGRGTHYVSRDADECAAILFLCEAGYEPFFDECGCGCKPSETCTAEECGPAPLAPNYLCADGTVAGPGDCVRDEHGACGWTYVSCSCSYDGVVYEPGDSFPSSDGCNTCSCSEGGLVACTERACVSDCRATGCRPGEYCTFCWFDYACVPDGAVC
jgi:hypothetical protein